MAVKLDHIPYEVENAEVSNCVSKIIQAFTNGLSVLKRLRERRTKRKARMTHHKADAAAAAAELRLSKSLHKGPQELAERYILCCAGMGDEFARGDAIAHASLAETLIKFNTGLVTIISSFLNHRGGKKHLDLDYKSLTNLSNASRKEALESMTQLYERLSELQLQSQLQLYSETPAPARESYLSSALERRASTAKPKRKSPNASRRTSGPVVTKMPIMSSNSSQPRLVVVRPKPKRKSSSSSDNSKTSCANLKADSLYASPMSSPLPRYVPVDPLALQAPIYNTSCSSSKRSPKIGPEDRRQRVDSFDYPRPMPWPHRYSLEVESYKSPIPELPNFTVAPRKSISIRSRSTTRNESPQRSEPPARSKSHLKSKPASPPPRPKSPSKRRMDKATPSSYTFASDSTKLGEIPQRHWNTPWNYDEAERMNAQAALAGPTVTPAQAERMGKKKGLFSFLRRGSGAGIEVMR